MLFRFLLLTLIVLTASSAEAAQRIRQLSATSSGDAVDVAFTVEGGFDSAELVEGLKSGVPTTFTFHVELFRRRPNWFDSTLAETTIEAIATFNSLTKEYLLNYRRDGKLFLSEIHADLPSLMRRMGRFEERRIFVATRPYYKLRVRVKADIMRGYFLYVIPSEVSTGWETVKVTSRDGGE